MILADALYYTSLTFQPHSLIDLATLTSAIGIALGTGKYAGIFTNSNKLWEQLSEAGKITNDPLWRMPLDDFYKKAMTKSDVADYINSSGIELSRSYKQFIDYQLSIPKKSFSLDEIYSH